MTQPSPIGSGVGFRNLRVYELNADTGLPNASGSQPYTGVWVSGVKSLEIVDPESQHFTHTGDDGPFAEQSLPAKDAMTGKLLTAKRNLTAEALFSGQKVFGLGQAQTGGAGTDKRGFEPQLAAMAYRQMVDTDPDSATFGRKRWEFKIMPMVQFIAIEGGFMADAMDERIYSLRMAFVTRNINGKIFANADEGFQRAQLVPGISANKPFWDFFLGNGVQTIFVFDPAYVTSDTGSIASWVDGVLTANTPTLTQVTISPAPASGKLVAVKREIL